GETALVADQFPALGGGDPGGVCFAQVPGMRFGHRGQWTDHRGGIGIDIRERRDGRVLAAGSAATTHGDHAVEGIAPASGMCTDTLADLPPAEFACERANARTVNWDTSHGGAYSTAPLLRVRVDHIGVDAEIGRDLLDEHFAQ